MTYQLRAPFAIVKLDEESECFKIEIEGEGYWIPLYISALGLYPPDFDWNIPGNTCEDDSHFYVEVKNSRYKKKVGGLKIHEWFGTDEMVIRANKNFTYTGEYKVQVISPQTILSPPHLEEERQTSHRTKLDRLIKASEYLSQEFPGNTLTLRHLGFLNTTDMILEDPIGLTIFILPADLFVQID